MPRGIVFPEMLVGVDKRLLAIFFAGVRGCIAGTHNHASLLPALLSFAWPSFPRSGYLLLFSKAVYAQFNTVAGFKVGRRIEAHAHTRRWACRNNVPRQQRHELAEITDEKRDTKDQIAGVAVLQHLAVNFEPQTQIVMIRHFITGDKIRS